MHFTIPVIWYFFSRSLTFPSLPSVAKQELLQDWKDAACVTGGPQSGDSL